MSNTLFLPLPSSVYPGSKEGAESELLAQAELLRRGYEIARPVVDDGVDLYIVSGNRCISVQVKGVSARPHHGGVRYLFTARKGWRADINLLRGHSPDHAWWVIPSVDIMRRGIMKTLTLAAPDARDWGKRAKSVWTTDYFNAWHRLDELLVG